MLAVALQGQVEPAFLKQDAREAEKSGDVVRAYLLYSQAAALNPADRAAWARSLALRTRAATEAKVMPGGDLPEVGPDDWGDEVTDKDLSEARRANPPVELKPAPGKRDYNESGDSRDVLEKTLKSLGIEVIFDQDYQPVTNLRFRLEQAEPGEALLAVQAATASFLVPVSGRIALAARDTIQKRQEFEETMAVAVPLPHPVSLQEVQELARAVQQIMELQKFGIDSQRRLVFMKDRVSKLRQALTLFEQLLAHRAEVSIEVEFIEVTENSALDIGMRLQTSFPLVWLSKIWNSTPTFPQGFANFATFGAGKSFFGLGIASAEMFATFADTSARTLMKSEMRSSEGTPVTFHVGDKFPVLSSGFFGPIQGPGEVFTPPPTFNFEDLGVVLKITPKVHTMDEVTLAVEAEFKVLTGEALNGIPIIANRKFNTSARIRNGEWAVLAGLVRNSEARTVTGLAGLSRIPVIGPALRSNTRNRESGQALLVIRPRVLGLPTSEILTQPMWTGSETRPRPAM